MPESPLTGQYALLVVEAYNAAYADGYRDALKANPRTKPVEASSMVPGKIYRVTVEGIAQVENGYYGAGDPIGISLVALSDGEEMLGYEYVEDATTHIEEMS